jgi:hypothetical protein
MVGRDANAWRLYDGGRILFTLKMRNREGSLDFYCHFCNKNRDLSSNRKML